jgi:transketolase
MTDIERRAIAVIRGLAMDAPHAARSGHQGTAMALAPLAHVLWSRIMRYDASDPEWPDRDRFVLSAGHASILLYSMLHLTGQGLELDDLEAFRQWGSRTPGHPEVHHTAGVEVTTGPLGQGFANAVGMAMTERWLRSRFGPEAIDHRTFVIAGDGCLSEGISHEAASLAGFQRLGRLVCVYDDNHVTIDGPTELALGDDAAARFEAYGWHVESVGEIAEDLDALEAAVRRAIDVEDRPSLIVLRSHIAYPSPKTDDPHTHGYALFDDEIAATKRVLGIPENERFWVPDDVLEWYREIGRRGAPLRAQWQARRASLPVADVFTACLEGRGLDGWEQKLPVWKPDDKPIATRVASGECIKAILDVVPGLVGGGADLTGNTGTQIKGHGVMSADEPAGRQIYFGVREHGMGGSMNGMALHGGVVPVGGTFLVFSDYMRGSLRLAALSEAHVVYSFTHDSVGVGEDGPTHQPVEHILALRAIPGLRVIRPADANETAQAWVIAVNENGPTALILSRQNLPILEGTAASDGVRLGAYTLVDTSGDPDLVLIGTGSEVAVCVDAAHQLTDHQVRVRVVSMPCWSLFDAQPQAYRASVLPEGIPRLSVEAAVTLAWPRYADASVGIDRFGASAPGDVALDNLGINVSNVVARALSLLDSRRTPR